MKGRIGFWPTAGPPFILPPDREPRGNVSAWRALYFVRNITLFSSSFVHIIGCELQVHDLNLSPNRNVENCKTTAGVDRWVQLRH